MRLFIAEKPQMAQAIAKGIDASYQKSNGYLQCRDRNRSRVTWCFGHLLRQADPAHYGVEFKKWSFESLPIIPDTWQLVPIPDKKKQLNTIKKLLKEADEVINAGDAGREGQLLVDEVLEFLGCRKPVKRLWLNALDDTTVQKALQSIYDNGKHATLKESAETRARADWLVGMNLTRAMTLMAGNGDVLSIGRVQTPTLKIVVDRDNEIENFVPKDYFVPKIYVNHTNGSFVAYWVPDDAVGALDEEKRLVSRSDADSLIGGLPGATGIIVQASDKNKKESPPLPHSLSSLQVAASSKFGFSAQKTLDLAQKLYEQKAMTYPRTDCRYLPDEIHAEAPKVLASLKKVTAGADKANPKLKSKAWNTKKLTEHHAIIPTGQKVVTEGDEGKIFGLVAHSYVVQFFPPHEYTQQTIIVEFNKQHWKAMGRKIIEPGWTDLVNSHDDTAEKKALPTVKKNDSAHCQDAEIETRKTTPPAHFTDGKLISAMANVHNFVSDPKVKSILKENAGIGTEATRASIIETLKKRKYLKTKGKQLLSTDKGRQLIATSVPQTTDPGITAIWEEGLDRIVAGEMTQHDFLQKIQRNIVQVLEEIGKSNPALFTYDKSSAKPTNCKKNNKGGGGKPKIDTRGESMNCPTCGSPMKPLPSKYKKNDFYWACFDDRHKKPVFVNRGSQKGD